MTEPTIYPKYRDTTAEAVAPYLEIPEVRRVRYHSYITTATAGGGRPGHRGPAAESGAIFYPPHFKEARVPLREDAGSSPVGSSEAGR